MKTLSDDLTKVCPIYSMLSHYFVDCPFLLQQRYAHDICFLLQYNHIIVKEDANAASDIDLGVSELKKLCKEYKDVYDKEGLTFPMDPYKQLYACVKAVFGSWMTPRAVKYREINNVKSLLGTATNIQTMVFGNMGNTSGTGVAFSRNPSTGENAMYGEYLIK